jgi:hypothetical protein
MTLYLQWIDQNTIRVQTPEAFAGFPGADAHPIRMGETYDDVPYPIWDRHRGGEVRIDLVRAEAEAERARDALAQEQEAGPADVPLDVRRRLRCPSCGSLLVAAEMQVRSVASGIAPPLSVRLVIEPVHGKGTSASLSVQGKPVRWCERCRTATVEL